MPLTGEVNSPLQHQTAPLPKTKAESSAGAERDPAFLPLLLLTSGWKNGSLS